MKLDFNGLTKEELQSISQDYQNTTKVFLIGYSSDVGAYNFESRTGAEQGPASFREIDGIMNLPKQNAYFQVDLG